MLKICRENTTQAHDLCCVTVSVAVLLLLHNNAAAIVPLLFKLGSVSSITAAHWRRRIETALQLLI